MFCLKLVLKFYPRKHVFTSKGPPKRNVSSEGGTRNNALFKSKREVWSLSFVHSWRHLEQSYRFAYFPPQVWLLTRSHSRTINKSLHFQSFPTRMDRTCTARHAQTCTYTHTRSHTTYLSRTAAKGTVVPLVWRTHFPIPLYFRSANTLSWLWCVRHSTFSLHVQVTCTVVKTTCSVFRVRTQLGHWCSGPPAPEEKLKLKICIARQHWSEVLGAPWPTLPLQHKRQNSEGTGGSEGIQRRKGQTAWELPSPAGAVTVSVVPSQSCSKAV